MIHEEPLACVTALAAVALFFVTAGPGSNRPFPERLLLWLMCITLGGAALYRTVAHYYPIAADYAKIVGYCLMFITRLGILTVSLYLVARWTYRCFPRLRTPVELAGDLVAGHRR